MILYPVQKLAEDMGIAPEDSGAYLIPISKAVEHLNRKLRDVSEFGGSLTENFSRADQETLLMNAITAFSAIRARTGSDMIAMNPNENPRGLSSYHGFYGGFKVETFGIGPISFQKEVGVTDAIYRATGIDVGYNYAERRDHSYGELVNDALLQVMARANGLWSPAAPGNDHSRVQEQTDRKFFRFRPATAGAALTA